MHGIFCRTCCFRSYAAVYVFIQLSLSLSLSLSVSLSIYLSLPLSLYSSRICILTNILCASGYREQRHPIYANISADEASELIKLGSLAFFVSGCSKFARLDSRGSKPEYMVETQTPKSRNMPHCFVVSGWRGDRECLTSSDACLRDRLPCSLEDPTLPPALTPPGAYYKGY